VKCNREIILWERKFLDRSSLTLEMSELPVSQEVTGRIKIITTVPPAVSDVYRINIFLKNVAILYWTTYHVNQVPYFLIKQMTLKSEPSLSYA
jgi:hypothetical protein